jgi:hypothetical protein
MHKRIFTAKRDIHLLHQRMKTASHFVYQGGMFAADREMVAYTNALTESCCIEDLNGTPIWIDDIKDFKTKVMSKHQEVMNELHEEYKKHTE